jgi:UDP-N-acetylglucosamine 1-carboxyvinyltransferase
MRYIVEGGNPLRGTVTPSGSKNAALPIIAATLLTSEKCVLENVPDISDIETMLKIMEFIGSEFTFEKNRLEIQTKEIKNSNIPHELVSRLRGSIVLLGPLLARVGKVSMDFPGGCVIGKRPVDTHTDALKKLGAISTSTSSIIELSAKKLIGTDITLKEISVTGTENLIMAATRAEGTTVIRLAACEPHVQDLCKFLSDGGAKIEGIGTHVVTIHGTGALGGVSHRVVSDYLEVGTLAIACAATRGNITITDVRKHDLDILWQKLEETGAKITFNGDTVQVEGSEVMKPIAKLDTGIFPKFPTDLQAPFGVMLTGAQGVSKIFETLFEGRLNYLFELEKMGAHIEFLNPHQALIIGPAKLKGAEIASCDIRAGAGLIIAALMAEGITEISNINYIERGYENIHGKLKDLGAKIERIENMKPRAISTCERAVKSDIDEYSKSLK